MSSSTNTFEKLILRPSNGCLYGLVTECWSGNAHSHILHEITEFVGAKTLNILVYHNIVDDVSIECFCLEIEVLRQKAKITLFPSTELFLM